MDEDPAAAFLQREHEELGDIGDEILGEPTSQSEDGGLEGREEELQFGDEPEELMAPQDDPYSAISSEDVLATEPECIRQWRREQEERLAKKDAAEQEAVEEQRQLAQRELEELYKRMDEQLEQTKARNREAEDAFIAERDADDPGHEWPFSLRRRQ